MVVGHSAFYNYLKRPLGELHTSGSPPGPHLVPELNGGGMVVGSGEVGVRIQSHLHLGVHLIHTHQRLTGQTEGMLSTHTHTPTHTYQQSDTHTHTPTHTYAHYLAKGMTGKARLTLRV